MKSSSAQHGELNCPPPITIMTDSPAPLPIVLLFIRIIFYVLEHDSVNNGYKFVIFGDLRNDNMIANESQNDNCEMLNENDYHVLLYPISIPTHTSHSPTIEFISIKYGFDVIRDENSIDSKTLSGM